MGRAAVRRAVFALVAPALVVAGACSDGDPEPDGYGPELREDFVESCTDGGEPEEACRCFYDHLAVAVPYERFKELDERIAQGDQELPDDIVDLAVTCSADQPTTTSGG
jgi:hypothetical protein